MNFLKPIVTSINEALNSFLNQFSNSEGINHFFHLRGWISNITDGDLSLVHSLINIKPAIENIIALVRKVDNSTEPLESAIQNAVPEIKLLLNDIKNLSSISTSVTLSNPVPLNKPVFWNELGDNLFDDILINYIQQNQQNLFALLHFLQIIEFTEIIPTDNDRVMYTRKVLNWDKFGDLFSNPTDLVKTNYNWGNGLTPQYTSLFQILENIFFNYGVYPKRTLIKEEYFNQYFSSFTGTNLIEGLEIKIIESWDKETNDYKKISLSIIPAPNSANNQLTGFILVPHVEGYASVELPISHELLLKGEGYFESDNFLSFKVNPEGSALQVNPLSTTTSVGGKISLVYAPVMPLVILGHEFSSRLMFNGVETSLEVKNIIADPEFILRLGMGDIIKDNNFLFAYEPGKGDGFIKKILGKKPFSSEFGLGLIWSSKHGIQFIGSGGLEIEIPLHDEKSSGETTKPLRINLLRIGFGIGNGKFKLNAGVDISFKLGPVSGDVNDIGASLALTKKAAGEPRGILGSLDFDWGFKFPKGIGVAIKASVVKGGGYLYIDPEKGRYYGAVELTISKFTLSVIAIITTKAPDGNEGFSLLFLINVTFSPSIPLTFGFSLSGIGGMIGVNRSLEPDALRIGVKTGAINHILFPVNVIENITEIIANLESIFPVEHKRYTFGIFFLLNWGVGTPLVRIKFGVILSVPDPVRLAIIGDLNMILPTKESPVLQLNVAFAGIIDFDAKYLTFDASIYNSKLLTFSLYGDIAVRVFWGEHREILMSVGGFHPKYNAPAYLKLSAKMDRLTISLIDKEYDDLKLSIKLQTYFAITSNTVQFGTRLDLDVRITVIQILGYFGFDVLFQFNPFKFYSNVYAGLAILYKGDPILSISMNFALDGPGPWHAVGDAEFKILGFKKTAHIDKVFGDAPDTTEPTVLIEPKILEALTSNKSISSESPFNKESYIQLYDNSGDDILLDPLGSLVVSQNIAPLGINLEKLGGSKLGDAGKYDIHEVKVNGVIQNLKTNKENFAPAQFRNMNDEDKISSASFEFLKSGVKIESEDQLIDGFVIKPLNYEMIVIDEVKRYTKPVSDNDRHFIKPLVKGGIISENALSKKAGVNGIVPALRVSQEKFKAVSKDSLDDLTTPISKDSLAEAYDTIEYNLQSNYSPYSISPTLTLPTD